MGEWVSDWVSGWVREGGGTERAAAVTTALPRTKACGRVSQKQAYLGKEVMKGRCKERVTGPLNHYPNQLMHLSLPGSPGPGPTCCRKCALRAASLPLSLPRCSSSLTAC